jgi:hypothetical protein
MNNSMLLRLSQGVTLALLLVLVPTILSAQERIHGRAIKRGLWKNQNVQYVEGQLLIKRKVGVTNSQARTDLSRFGGVVFQDFDDTGFGAFTFPSAVDVLLLIHSIESSPSIEYAEPNLVFRTALTPNDPYFQGSTPANYAHQWPLHNVGQVPPDGGLDDADIDLTPKKRSISYLVKVDQERG